MDTLILHSLHSFFNAGNVNTKVNRNISVFRITAHERLSRKSLVAALKDLINIVIPHF
jgi:hypothetical protein